MNDKVKNASASVVTPDFILSFPQLETPDNIMGSKEKFFSIQMLFDKSKDHAWIQSILKDLYTKKWGDAKRASTFKNPWRDGDLKFEESNMAVYQGKMFANAKAGEKDKILFLDGLKNVIPAGTFYAGCICRAKIDISTFDNQFGKGISFWLRGLQFVKDGTPLGGATPAKADDFETVEGAKAPNQMSDEDF